MAHRGLTRYALGCCIGHAGIRTKARLAIAPANKECGTFLYGRLMEMPISSCFVSLYTLYDAMTTRMCWRRNPIHHRP